MSEVPEGGLCLSAFLVITEKRQPRRVLMGHLNVKAPWDHIGALDQKRVERHSKGWMLPSSHLILHESPQDAAKRILKEQLEILDLELSEPKVFSDIYEPGGRPIPHWDIGFIFMGQLAEIDLPKPNAWTELRFIDVTMTKKEEFARSHEDILTYAGLIKA
jgi:ADP-ribose pyrophosphatase YjhB (NUDIX family)